MSTRSCNAIFALLTQHYENVGITIIDKISDLEKLVIAKPDLAFMGMKFLPKHPAKGRHDPDKIWISAYLDAHNIRYTGSDRQANELEENKHLAKQCALNAGLATSQFFIANQNVTITNRDIIINFPLFVKPTDLGAGQGVDEGSVVTNIAELRLKIKSITSRFHTDSLVESYLPGREFSVAILKDEFSDKLSVMPIEIIVDKNEQGDRIRGSKVKAADTESITLIKDLFDKTAVCKLALAIYYALGARDYGRIDIRMDKNGIPQFLEANLTPSLIDNWGSFPKACAMNAGMDYATILLRIVRLGLAHNKIAHKILFKSSLSNIDNNVSYENTLTQEDTKLSVIS